MKRRLFLIVAAVVPAFPAIARARRTRLLLVCQFGSVKSAISRELIGKRAAQRGIAIEVSSRGITPDSHINPTLLEKLRARGIDPQSQPLTALAPDDVLRADFVAIFNDLPPGYRPKSLIDWRDTGSFNETYDAEEPRLLKRIDALLDVIAER